MDGSRKIQFIILTGVPGVGKTTLVKKICEVLKSKELTVNGFFTEEMREGRERIGFDVVTFNGDRQPLARTSTSAGCVKGPLVGKYAVNVKSFESCALPIFNNKAADTVLVLDEIGKMELFSESFKKEVTDCFTTSKSMILATIPVAKGKAIPLVEMVRTHPKALLFTVDRNNRTRLVDEIVEHIIQAKIT